LEQAEPLLQITGLSVNYGKIAALSSVSLSIQPREIVTVLGANGAGKSTLLLSIIGKLNAPRGAITFSGQPVSDWTTQQRVRKGISLVPEGRRILVSMTVEENLLVGASCRTDKHAVLDEIEALMKRYPNLGQRRHAVAATLSGGEQQMLAIARALLAKPNLLLLDEPSLGLSPKFVGQLFELITELRDQGMTILLVEQNTQQALRVSDRAYVLQLGKVAFQGAAKEILERDDLVDAYLGNQH
jgi:branched-chain amino acid transport system ATP-binding protein